MSSVTSRKNVTELSGYVINELAPDVSSFILTPVQEDQNFGSLYEIKSEADEIFISGANVDNVEIIDAITASRLKATGSVVTKSTTINAGIQSSAFTDTATPVKTSSTNTTTSSSSSSSSGSSSNGGYSY